MLTYEEFIEKARRISNDPPDPDMPDKDWTNMRHFRGIPEDSFWASWVTGGMSGGNCWGSGDNYPVEPESEPGFLHGLVSMLESVDVRLREAIAMQADIVTGGSHTDSGYYGNFTNYGFKFVAFDDVYDRLVGFGYAHPREAAPRA